MAFAMSGLSIPYTDAAGNEYATTFWVPASFTIVPADNVAGVSWYGYRDRAAWDARKAPIGQKQYRVNPDEFATLVEEHMTPGGPNILEMLFAYATGKKDVVDDPADPTKNVSFFDGAVLVNPPAPHQQEKIDERQDARGTKAGKKRGPGGKR